MMEVVWGECSAGQSCCDCVQTHHASRCAALPTEAQNRGECGKVRALDWPGTSGAGPWTPARAEPEAGAGAGAGVGCGAGAWGGMQPKAPGHVERPRMRPLAAVQLALPQAVGWMVGNASYRFKEV